jgi:hypothetical protein
MAYPTKRRNQQVRVREHILKARRLEASLGRLDEVEDFEMVIDLRMLVAAHLFNGAMHVEGVTHAHADHGHTDTPPLDGYTKKPSVGIFQGAEALHWIESIRSTYVRGGEGYNAGVAGECRKRFEEAKACFMAVIGAAAATPDWAGEAPGERKTAL